MNIRAATDTDVASLVALFSESVHQIAARTTGSLGARVAGFAAMAIQACVRGNAGGGFRRRDWRIYLLYKQRPY